MQLVRPYVRVSTDEQAQEGFSIGAQRERITDFARSQGWVIAEWYIEEGRSAKDMDRPELARLRADLRPGEIVVVYRLDRLTRSVLDLHTLLREWEAGKVGFRSVTEVYDTTSAMGRLFLTLVAAMAQWERENLAERVKMGMLQMVREGKWYGGPVPFGYLYDRDAGRLIPHPEHAPLVRQIYRWYVEGLGTRAIAVRMNETGLRTNQGAAWAPYTIYHILRSQVYLGHTTWNKKGKGGPLLIENTHEPIVSAELHQAVQNALARHKGLSPRQVASSFPLTGIARCGLCGGRVNGKTQPQYDKKGIRRPEWDGRDYWCQERKVRKACTLPAMSAARLEEAVLAKVDELADAEKLRALAATMATSDDHQEERRQLEAELRTITRKKRRWHDAYENEAITAADLKDRTASLATREETIRTRLAQIAPAGDALDPAALADHLKNFRWYWQHATVEEQRELLAGSFVELTVFPGYEVDLKLKPLRQ